MKKLKPKDLAGIDRNKVAELEKPKLVELTLGLIDLCIDLYEKANRDSSNSSRPPSSDDPAARCRNRKSGANCANEDCEERVDSERDSQPEESAEVAAKESGDESGEQGRPATENGDKRNPGRQSGSRGFGRNENDEPDAVEDHWPETCDNCGEKLRKPDYAVPHAGHFTYELEKDEEKKQIRLVCTLHRYYTTVCSCGCENRAKPGEGTISELEGRKCDLKLSENRLVGPLFAAFIAALNREYKMSRNKIRQYLIDWFGFRLSVGTIDQCIREAGVACYPIVDQLVEELQVQEVVHVDETPWYQKGVFLWLWVAVNRKIAVYAIGSRKKETLLELITGAFLGWLVTDGYGAYRDREKRQRCLAHLIRKAVALACVPDDKSQAMADWLLREMRGLIKAMAEGEDGVRKCGPILARLKRACNLGSKSDNLKLRSLAKEILNDWDAVVAFVKNPELPPTNNEAERALRMAVIFRRICFGTRTEEGSRSFAAFLSVLETCKRRSISPWNFIASLIASARKGENPEPMPAA
jgi:transposase